MLFLWNEPYFYKDLTTSFAAVLIFRALAWPLESSQCSLTGPGTGADRKREANTPPYPVPRRLRSLIINLKLLICLEKYEEEANVLYQSLFNNRRK